MIIKGLIMSFNHQIKQTIIFAIIGISSMVNAFSQDSTAQNRFVFNGYLKDMQTFMNQSVDDNWIGSNLIHNRLNFKWLPNESWNVSLELRNRMMTGELLKIYPRYAQILEVDDGYWHLSKNIIDETGVVLNTSIDRLWLSYAAEKWMIRAGRQRINWSQTLVWNPNDVFNPYSYLDFDYEERAGCDAVRFQYFSDVASAAEMAVKINHEHEITAMGLYRVNRWGYDWQVIGGVLDSHDWVLGTGWSGQLGKGGFRGEASWFVPMRNNADNQSFVIASVGYDYAFKNSLMLQVEALYNGNDEAMTGMGLVDFSNSQIGVKQLFMSDVSIFTGLSYTFTPLINGSLSGIINPKNEALIVLPSLNISILNNLELLLSAQFLQAMSADKQEQETTLLFGRLKWSF
jgi:hypothetical protein